MGDSSIALCWQTITRNQGELATGRSNISHSGSSSDKQTIFSVGSGAIWDNSGIQKQQKKNVWNLKWQHHGQKLLE